jgi:hypothetical protein
MEIIVACETVRDELELALEREGVGYPVIWIESGLHSFPDKLRAKLQEELDGIAPEYDRVLFVFGTCGNAVMGLRTGDYELIIPKVDDCISLLLGSVKRRADFSREHAAYYLTDGWLRFETNIWTEFQRMAEKYGPERAARIGKALWGNYRTLAIIDVDGIDYKDFSDQTDEIAAGLGLNKMRVEGTTAYIEELLKGPWPKERYIITPPNTEITFEDVLITGASESQL